MTLQTLKSWRLDSNFKLFWTTVTTIAKQMNVIEPSLPCGKKTTTEVTSTPKDHYRPIY